MKWRIELEYHNQNQGENPNGVRAAQSRLISELESKDSVHFYKALQKQQLMYHSVHYFHAPSVPFVKLLPWRKKDEQIEDAKVQAFYVNHIPKLAILQDTTKCT